MNSGIPILMISMQIPVLPDTDASQVLEAIAQQVNQALESIREQQSEQTMEDVTENDGREMVTAETFEPFTEGTADDLLVALGYAPKTDE